MQILYYKGYFPLSFLFVFNSDKLQNYDLAYLKSKNDVKKLIFSNLFKNKIQISEKFKIENNDLSGWCKFVNE